MKGLCTDLILFTIEFLPEEYNIILLLAEKRFKNEPFNYQPIHHIKKKQSGNVHYKLELTVSRRS